MSTNSTSLSTGSKKRRQSNEARPAKFYAVRVGVRPGIYRTWKECYEQIDGFKGARYKAFLNYNDAQDFVAGKEITTKLDSTQVERFYGVAVGHHPGVYTDWTEASLQIKDIKRPMYKKFPTRAEAEFFVMTKGKDLKKYLEAKEQEQNEGICEEKEQSELLVVTDDTEERKEPKAKKRKIADSSQSSKEKKFNENLIQVYTDGSSRRNGSKEARAGVGVFFGTNDPRNLSEPLQGEQQTNQRAELTAVLRALQICPKDKDVQIFTDSTYSINSLTKWYKIWLKNGWRTSNGFSVVNKDLVQAIRHLIDCRITLGSKTDLTWIRGHSQNFGNEAADRLAVSSATAPL
ncbi:putative ribonuclease h [Erysiphe necator]|uniref:Ribonuclease H n=1 Tax=Uncinula necator TaxID=52586 RepID=A0A0B1PB27_UNCNE|nr:putative ribonuclease h [Erysiphe necator]